MLQKSMLISILIHLLIGVVIFALIEMVEKTKRPKMLSLVLHAYAAPLQKEAELVKPKSEPKQKVVPKPKVKPKPTPTPTPKPKPKPKSKPKPKATIKPLPKKVAVPIVEKSRVAEPLEEIILEDVNNSALPIMQKVEQSEPKVTTAQRENIESRYLQTIFESIQKLKKYPRHARKLGQSGVVKVSFDILEDGTITEVFVSEESGFGMLDAAAKKILTNLVKVAPIPKELNRKSMQIVLPIEYRLE